MKKNEALHQLIHNLSSNEKRYFKIYASRHTIGEENNYVKLFSLFDDVKTFDDKLIETQASKAEFVKYFAAEKNYLYNMILDCLDIYHKESAVDRQISKWINIGRILMEKKLDEQGAAVLQKARKLSTFHNRHENLLTVNYLLKKKAFSKESIDGEALLDFQKEDKQVLSRLREKLYYQNCYDELLLRRRLQGHIVLEQEKTSWIAKFPHLNEDIPTDFSSFDTSVYYLLSRLEFCRNIRDRAKGRKLASLLISLMEENRAKIAGEFIDRYIYVLYVFLVLRLYTNIDEAYATLDKLKNLDDHVDAKLSKNEHARCFEFYFTALTDMRLESKEYQKVLEIVPEIEKHFDTYAPHMTPSFILVLHYNLACLFFGLGQYRQALRWLNKVRNVTTIFREDLFYELRTLNMIIHIELGNEDLLPNLIKSAKYHSKKYTRSTGVQDAIINHIKQLFKAHDNTQKRALYQKLSEKLRLLREDEKENTIFIDVDLVSWAENKYQ